jgi:ATP-dependent DNA helicase RecG
MKIVAETNDGFKLAEEDLKMRGEGDLFGKAQSGLPEFMTGSVVSDYQVMVVARDEAKRIVQADPDLKAEKLADLQAVIKYKKIVQARA